ncbi:MAG TPA: hypothetical protein DGT21_03240, partial [Armatimonadetes bacterium]|nr:hypothetical protein [Armatimonadota bacterium]
MHNASLRPCQPRRQSYPSHGYAERATRETGVSDCHFAIITMITLQGGESRCIWRLLPDRFPVAREFSGRKAFDFFEKWL